MDAPSLAWKFLRALACAGGLASSAAGCSNDEATAPPPILADSGTSDSGKDSPDAPAADTQHSSDGATAADGPGTQRDGARQDALPPDRDVSTSDTGAPSPRDARADVTFDADAPAASDASIDSDTSTGADATDGATRVDGPMGDAAPTCAVCSSYGQPEQAGRITTATLNALSGIAVSQRNAGVVYVHNDRNRAEFFAVSEAGALLGTFTVSGGMVEDQEDMAVGHCPSGSCVYLADIGNNVAPHTQFAILRMPEPDVQVGQPVGTVAVNAERLAFSYADGPHNAESLLVDPNSDTLYIITKLDAGLASAVYRIPATFGAAVLTAEKVADLPVPKSTDQPATSASAHPCQPSFLLRTNNTLYEFRAPAGSRFEDAFSATPVVVPVAQEPQGEGVAYRPDGRGYFTTSEGAQPALNRVGCL